ncbi:MAG: dTDP-4-dehydrorhamnose reductase [Chthoniobacterales bacterium]
MSRPRVWVLGSRGRLGGALLRKWADKFDVRGLSRADFDFEDTNQLQQTLEAGDFDWIINCAAMTNVDACESEIGLAQKINVTVPQILAEVCTKKSARLIHVSTDYVFDGTQTTPYRETDDAKPLGIYGRTKLAGELSVLTVSPDHAVMRVSWLFGPEKPSFVDAMIQQAQTKEEVSAIDDKTSSPTFSDDIADWMAKFIERDCDGGMYHVCNSGGCTWREYAEHAIRSAADNGLPVKTRDVKGIPLDSMKAFVAKRPRHTVMTNEKLATAIGEPLRNWQLAVEDFVRVKYSK